MFTNLANELGHHHFFGIEVGDIHGFRPGLVGFGIVGTLDISLISSQFPIII